MKTKDSLKRDNSLKNLIVAFHPSRDPTMTLSATISGDRNG